MGIVGSSPGGKVETLKQTSHLRLKLKLRMRGAIPPLPQMVLWGYA